MKIENLEDPAREAVSSTPAAAIARRWMVIMGLLLAWMAGLLCININRPWTGHHDYLSVVVAQAAHNNLRAGWAATCGAPTGFYYGTLPIPIGGFYIHHPPAASWIVTGLFATFGENEWAARILPIACSLFGALVLWLLVESCLGPRAATMSLAVFALMPMELYFGRIVEGTLCSLTWMLASLLCLRYWELTRKRRWWWGVLICLLVGMWMSWAAYIQAVVLAGLLLARRRRPEIRLGAALLVMIAMSMTLYLVFVRVARPDAWENLWGALNFRTGVAPEKEAPGVSGWHWLNLSKLFAGFYDEDGSLVTWKQWLQKQREFLGPPRISPLVWVLAAIGAALSVIKRNKIADLRWLSWAALSVSLTAALFVLAFRNGSYVHDFWGFFFVAPLAIMSGVALDWMATPSALAGRSGTLRRSASRCLVAAIILFVGRQACQGVRELHWLQDPMLSHWGTHEPEQMVTGMGHTLQSTFPENVILLSNLPELFPHLEYYAQRIIIFHKPTREKWDEYLTSDPGPGVGGLIWLEAPGASELAANLPPGVLQPVDFGSFHFLLWKPAAQQIYFRWAD